MNTPAKFAAYVAVLVGGGWAAGNAVGPLSPAPPQTPSAPTEPAAPGAPAPTVAPAVDLPGGLGSSRDDYTLVPVTSTLTPGSGQTFAFRITGPDGAPVTGHDYSGADGHGH